MPAPKPATFAERYDRALHYVGGQPLPQDAPRPAPTCEWPEGNLEFIERYGAWMLSGGVSELVTYTYHVMMAGHVFGLTLKTPSELDPDKDLDCALEYLKARGLGKSWVKNSGSSLKHFRRFLRLERGLGEESKITPFDVPRRTQGLPEWIVNELERYQHLLQRNWRTARIDVNLRAFWDRHGRMWRFFFEQRGVETLADLKRQHVLDYVDRRLSEGRSANGVNNELRILHGFLVFLQDEGYSVPNSLLRIPGLKLPDPLPRYLTDEQVMKLRGEVELQVAQAKLASHRRVALLIRAAFYVLWQGGMRLGEVEELRLEDLDLPARRLSVRDGKGRKDRTIYLAATAVQALEQYLEVRGQGSSDHVFLFRNAALSKSLLQARLKQAGERVGVKVYPHRLRHTCATQLLNAGCRITSIQRFLGHKSIGSTMIYARAHDQTVAEDYFAAMERVEQRLELTPARAETNVDSVVKVQEPQVLFQLIKQLEVSELCFEERLDIAEQLRRAFGVFPDYAPPARLGTP